MERRKPIATAVIAAALAIFTIPVLAKPATTGIDVPPLRGGEVLPDALDVSAVPMLALPPSLTELLEAEAANPQQTGGGRLDKTGAGTQAYSGLQCATPTGPLPPPGWTLTSAANIATCSYPYTSGYYSVCFGPGHYCFNQVAYTSFYDIPVGETLRFCSVIGVPNGWSVTQTNLPASCPGSGQDWVMQHTSCVSGDTNCYPQSASISASPQSLTVPYGQSVGSTTINWNSVNYNNPCVWVRNSGGSDQLWGCSGNGAHSATWPYVPSGGTSTVWLSAGGSASSSPNIAQVVVTGVRGTAPTISASPQSVSIPEGTQNGSTTISYNLTGSGYSSMCMWVKNSDGGPASVWSCNNGLTHSEVWPYVPRGGTSRISLSASSTSATPELGAVTVTGVATSTTPRISASPQTVTVPQGQSAGSTTISYDLTGTPYSSMCIWVQNTGGSAQVWGCVGGLTWSGVWPYVPRGGTSTVWLSTSQTSSTPRLAQVVVTGI